MKSLLISRTADNTKKIAPLHSPLPTPGTVTILVGTRKRRRQLFSWPLQSRLWFIRVVSDISAHFRLVSDMVRVAAITEADIAQALMPKPVPKRSPDITARAVGGNPLRIRRLGFVLKFVR
jgi:hypothetical protein